LFFLFKFCKTNLGVHRFLLNYLYAIVATAMGIIIYWYIEYKKPHVNWGSVDEGVLCRDAFPAKNVFPPKYLFPANLCAIISFKVME